ncbi:colicin D domain-containing protein [Micromonospora sp. A200]|uniref:colicin D domain-containing protein n=1 Tax=Micromonospora sp. A200 TaxID=2940568 RepID=UPI002476A4D0|nr:colicin D domain-containing protein [Micromonospora sp. A200]
MVLAITGLMAPMAAAARDAADGPFLAYVLRVDDVNPKAIRLGSEVELEAELQAVIDAPLPVHYRGGVYCEGDRGLDAPGPDHVTLIPPAPEPDVYARVPVEVTVNVPWDCMRTPNPLFGYHGRFYLETGGTAGDYNQMSVVFFTISPPDLVTTRAQMQKKYKHAPDFGVTLPQGVAGFDAFEAALHTFVAAPDTLHISGIYTRMPDVPAILHYNPTTRQVVIQVAATGDFVSGWKMSPEQLQYVERDRRLGGGG